MNHQPTDDERLRRLLEQTVADVEPSDGLEAIRSRIKVTDMPSNLSSSRPWIWGALGAAVATAAVIGGVAVLGNQEPSADDPGPVTSPTTSPTPPEVSPSETSGGAAATVPVYYVGDTPHGPRLYREFRQSTEAGDPATVAAGLAVSATPLDPDYSSPWPAGTQVATVTFNGDVATVDLEPGDGGALGLHDRPAGTTEAEAELALQQVIYTVQGALQEGRPGVQFLIDGEHTDQVLGQPASEPLAQGDPLDVLSLMNITAPEEGGTVTGSFEASGVASSFEANVQWQIRQGGDTVKSGFTTAEGWMDKLYPWATPVNVSGLAPGTYTFVAMTDDPSGGAEGNGPYTDTKTIVVE